MTVPIRVGRTKSRGDRKISLEMPTVDRVITKASAGIIMGFSHSAGLLKSSPKMIDKKKMKFRLVSSCLIMAVVIDFMSLLKNVL